MKLVRNGVFETNSSSAHSLAYGTEYILKGSRWYQPTKEHDFSNPMYRLDAVPDYYRNYTFYEWLADGWTTSTTRSDSKKPREKVVLCCGKHKVDDVEKHLNLLGLHYTKTEERTAYKFIFSNKELFCFLRRYGIGAANKFIHQEILQLPVECLKDVIDGYMSGDGSFDGKYHKATSVSRNLIYGLAACS